MRVPYAFSAKSVRSASEWNSMQHWGLVIGIWEIWSDLCRLATTGLFWISCSRCIMQWAKWLAFQSKTLPVRQSGLGEAGLECGLGHVWVYIRNGMLLGNPLGVGPCYSPRLQSQSCPNVTAAKWLLASRALPSVWDKEKKITSI
jgi:hypothetical protein